MEEMIRSKFLRVTPSEEEETFLVIHERNQTVMEAAPEVIDFIDQYIAPHAPAPGDSDNLWSRQRTSHVYAGLDASASYIAVFDLIHK